MSSYLRQPSNREMQMADMPRGNSLQKSIYRPQGSSTLIAKYQMLRQIQQNQAAATSSRMNSRIHRGHDPSVARPRPSSLMRKPRNQKEWNQRNITDRSDKIQNMDEHRIPLQQLLKKLDTNTQTGLPKEVAQRRNRGQGDNKLPPKPKTPKWILFLKQITNWFSILLWVGIVLSIIAFVASPTKNQANIYIACVLIIVVFITGIITYSQQAQSEAIMEGFKDLQPLTTKCMRDGKLSQIPAEKLVRGDIIEVSSGDKIPADIRIIVSNQMKVNNSALTGQAEPLLRSTQCTHPYEPFQTKNLAFFGTLCQQGRGRGVVINVGSKTVLGQIVDLAATSITPKTPLRKQIDRFVLIISVIAISLAILFFLLALFIINYPVIECILYAIGILVANVPEGLLACIAISLSITAQRLSEKQILVKNLQAVQTLGSTSCLCSDKTGTLTQNKMKVQNLWYDGNVIRGQSKEMRDSNYQYQYDTEDPSFEVLHHTAIVCSQAQFDVNEEDMKSPIFTWGDASVIGNATQAALVKFYQPIEDIQKTRLRYPLAKCKDNSDAKLPFNSVNKFSISIAKDESGQSIYTVYIKGAPENIWKFCGRIFYEGRFKNIQNQDRNNFDSVNLRFGKNGQRVLGFAMLPLPKQDFPQDYLFDLSTPQNFNFPLQNFIFVGLVSFIDPPKLSIPYAIKQCQSAGIKMIMLTGDQVLTAQAVAKQIGIITLKTNQDLKELGYQSEQALQKANAVIIHGDMIIKAFEDGYDQGQQILQRWVNKSQVVFARTTPAQKLLIVKACQAAGYVVGVTGDGVNDSPAIKQADIGISMGISGSDVTKDAADMVLLNDDFSSIIDGVEEGRKIYDNLKKTIIYLLTSNMTQIWPFVALVILQIPLPLSNIFMLIICIGTDIYPALSLAYEQAQIDIMTRKPRKQTDHLVNTRLLTHAYGQMGQIAAIGGFFTYFVVMSMYGFNYNVILFLLGNNAIYPYVVDQNTGIGSYNINQNGIYTFDPNNLANFGNPYFPPSNTTIFDESSTQYWNPQFPSWTSTQNNQLDLRGFYMMKKPSTPVPAGALCTDPAVSGHPFSICQQFAWPDESTTLSTFSNISGNYVRYTTEALFYAQSAYFVTIVMVQWSNIFACKSRKVSFTYSGMNKHMMGGILLETGIFVFFLYVPGVNKVFGGRPLPFFMLGIPGLCFSMTLLIWEEIRKFLMNLETKDGEPNWWHKNLLW